MVFDRPIVLLIKYKNHRQFSSVYEYCIFYCMIILLIGIFISKTPRLLNYVVIFKFLFIDSLVPSLSLYLCSRSFWFKLSG